MNLNLYIFRVLEDTFSLGPVHIKSSARKASCPMNKIDVAKRDHLERETHQFLEHCRLSLLVLCMNSNIQCSSVHAICPPAGRNLDSHFQKKKEPNNRKIAEIYSTF